MGVGTILGLIAPSIIQGIFGIGTSLVSGGMQRSILEEGQVEARKLYKEQLKESKRQFDLSYGLQQRKLGMTQESMARSSFRDQVSRLTQIINKNENLKNLYLNRLSTLRG